METRARAHEFITHVCAQAIGESRCRSGLRLDGSHLEFSSQNLRKRAHRRSQVAEKTFSPKNGLAEFVSVDFQGFTATRRPRRHRVQGVPGELRSQERFDCPDTQRRLPQARTPLLENRADLSGVFFRDEVVQPRVHFQQSGIQRPLRPIVRLKMELCCIGGLGARIDRACIGKNQAPKRPRHKRERSPLATTKEEIPPLSINPQKINRGTALHWTTQSNVPWKFTWSRNLAAAAYPVKAAGQCLTMSGDVYNDLSREDAARPSP